MTERSASPKSADAYRTISEVADDLKLPQHVLRFWETRFPQVKPLKRAGGRRFYRPEDVELLRAVKVLLYGDGYTIKGVQRMLREQGPRALTALAAEVRPRSGRPSARIGSDSVKREEGQDGFDPADREVARRQGDLDPRSDGAPERPTSAFAAQGGSLLSHRSRLGGTDQEQASSDAAGLSEIESRLQAVMLDLQDCERLLVAARSEQRR